MKTQWSRQDDPNSWSKPKGSGSIWVGHPAIARGIIRVMKWFEPAEVYCELVNPVGYPGPQREIIGRTPYRWYWLAKLRCPRSGMIDRTLILFKVGPRTPGDEQT